MFISVALCTYNGEKFLDQQLESIFSQTTPVDEIVINDDLSTDGTTKIIDKYIKENPGIIRLHINSSRKGPIKNFEDAISKCKGDIIFLSDQDDIWHTEKVELQVGFLTSNPKALLVFTDGFIIDEKDKRTGNTLWNEWKFTEAKKQMWKDNINASKNLASNRNYVTGATVAFKSVLKNAIFPFVQKKDYWHDTWIALKAAEKDGLYFIETPLINYRVHSNQLVGTGNGITIQSSSSPEKQSKNVLKKLLSKFK